jgi:hypothetical protein
VLVETDTSNPDVMKAVHGEIECAAFDLDEADGWIELVNFCDTCRDAVVVINSAAQQGRGGTVCAPQIRADSPVELMPY